MINATLPKKAWTLNIAAEEGTKEDAYKCVYVSKTREGGRGASVSLSLPDALDSSHADIVNET